MKDILRVKKRSFENTSVLVITHVDVQKIHRIIEDTQKWSSLR